MIDTKQTYTQQLHIHDQDIQIPDEKMNEAINFFTTLGINWDFTGYFDEEFPDPEYSKDEEFIFDMTEGNVK